MQSKTQEKLIPKKRGSKPYQTSNPDQYPLALFRILFGLILIRFLWDLYTSDWVTQNFETSQIELKYDWLPWIQSSGGSVRLLLILLICSSIFFTFGLLYRLACITILVTYFYLFFLDPTWYDMIERNISSLFRTGPTARITR